VQRRIDINWSLPAKIIRMRPVAFGEALSSGTRLALFSDDKPDRIFTVIKFWIDETSGVALALKTGVPTYQVEDEKGRTHLTTCPSSIACKRIFARKFREIFATFVRERKSCRL